VIQSEQPDTEATHLSTALLSPEDHKSQLGDHRERHSVLSMPKPKDVVLILLPLCAPQPVVSGGYELAKNPDC